MKKTKVKVDQMNPTTGQAKRCRSRKEDNTVTQKVKSVTSRRMNKSSSKKHTRSYLSSSTDSSDGQQSGSSSSDSS
jgi:hypothetical protein